MITVLIADDHDLLRRGLRASLAEDNTIQVVAEAHNGREAVDLAVKHHPDVAVLDLAMPELNGLEATRQICAKCPKTRVLALSVHESEQMIREVLQAGARGYLFKSDAGLELLTAVKSVAGGRPYFTSKVAKLVLDGFLSPVLAQTEPGKDAVPLTPREREIIQLIAEGKSTKEVAQKLGISVKTAETHRTNLMRKLDLHSVAELVRYAVRNDIVNVT